jgi:hypothetical protein
MERFLTKKVLQGGRPQTEGTGWRCLRPFFAVRSFTGGWFFSQGRMVCDYRIEGRSRDQQVLLIVVTTTDTREGLALGAFDFLQAGGLNRLSGLMRRLSARVSNISLRTMRRCGSIERALRRAGRWLALPTAAHSTCWRATPSRALGSNDAREPISRPSSGATRSTQDTSNRADRRICPEDRDRLRDGSVVLQKGSTETEVLLQQIRSQLVGLRPAATASNPGLRAQFVWGNERTECGGRSLSEKFC